MLQTLSLTSCGDRSKLYEELSASKDLWLCTSFVFLWSKVVNPFDTVRSFFSFKDQTVSYQTMYLVFITLLLCSSHHHLRRLLELAVIKLHIITLTLHGLKRWLEYQIENKHMLRIAISIVIIQWRGLIAGLQIIIKKTASQVQFAVLKWSVTIAGLI